MSQTSHERFRELAMKLVSFECSAEEKAELRRMIDENPALREELQKLCLSVGIARELLPLTKALEATEGRMSTREMESFKAALTRRRNQKRGQASDSPSGQDSQRAPKGGRAPIIDVEPEPPRSAPASSSIRSPSRSLLGFTIALCLAGLSLWLLSRGCGGSLRWKFAIVQPVLNRSDEQIAPLRSYLGSHFSNATIETMENGGREMRDWEISKTGNMVQVKCILEGVRLHPSWLVDRFEVKGWRAGGTEFQKVIPVQNGDWTSALEEVRRFVRDY